MLSCRSIMTFAMTNLMMSYAFADFQPSVVLNSGDQLAQLSRDLGQPNSSRFNNEQASAFMSGQSAQATNASFKSYPASSSATSTWLINRPIDTGRVSSEFGMRNLLGSTRHHSGIDIAAPSGTPIYATGPGLVTKSGWGTGYGNYIEIDHGNGYITRYAHASRLIANSGERVKAGQHIANVGCTGRCTGPHLHFEVVKSGKRQNPSTYLALLD